MLLCQTCQFLSYCRKLTCPIVTDQEMSNELFIRSIRQHAYQLRIPSRRWPDVLGDWLRDYPGRFVDALGQVQELDLSSIEYPDGLETEDSPHARWCHDFCNTPCLQGVRPFVRKDARERVRTVATLMPATFPVRASTWLVVPANDNETPKGEN